MPPTLAVTSKTTVAFRASAFGGCNFTPHHRGFRMGARAQRFVISLSAVVVLIIVGSAAARVGTASTRVDVASGAGLAIPCAYACYPCYGDWVEIESVWIDGEQPYDSRFGHACRPSELDMCVCDPGGGGGTGELVSILDSRKTDGATLAKLLADHSESVTLNTERSALQVKGCAAG